MKSYLRSKSNSEVEGLPYQLVREAARGKTFLSIQTAINEKADELGLYAGISEKIRKEKDNVRIRAEQAKKEKSGSTGSPRNSRKREKECTKLPAAYKNRSN